MSGSTDGYYDWRSRTKPCIACGKPTRSEDGFCWNRDCRITTPADPLIELVKVLQPTHPIPQPALPPGFRPRCADNPDWFFSERPDERVAAQFMCEGCPLKDWCIEFATANDEPGVWGGTSRKQRRQLKVDQKKEEVQVA